MDLEMQVVHQSRFKLEWSCKSGVPWHSSLCKLIIPSYPLTFNTFVHPCFQQMSHAFC